MYFLREDEDALEAVCRYMLLFKKSKLDSQQLVMEWIRYTDPADSRPLKTPYIHLPVCGRIIFDINYFKSVLFVPFITSFSMNLLVIVIELIFRILDSLDLFYMLLGLLLGKSKKYNYYVPIRVIKPF